MIPAPAAVARPSWAASMTVTRAPARAAWNAVLAPRMPAPTTTICMHISLRWHYPEQVRGYDLSPHNEGTPVWCHHLTLCRQVKLHARLRPTQGGTA